MIFFNFFHNHMVQKYQNEIAPIFYYGISTKTIEKDLKIPHLQPPDWNHPYWMTLYDYVWQGVHFSSGNSPYTLKTIHQDYTISQMKNWPSMPFYSIQVGHHLVILGPKINNSWITVRYHFLLYILILWMDACVDHIEQMEHSFWIE